MDLSMCTDAQRESIKHLDGELFIAAGAGSGKTFTLQNRIAYALSPDSSTDGNGPVLSSIDEVLAITFMEKAAAEIKARVRAALRAEGRVDEALKVDAAWISTIHGMCSRILREHALEAGLDPSFELYMEFEAGLLLDEAIDRVLFEERESIEANGASASEYSALFAEYGVVPKGKNDKAVLSMLKAVLSKAASFKDGLDAVRLNEAKPKPNDIARKLLCAYEHAGAYAEAVFNPKKPQKRIVEALPNIEFAIDRLEGFLLDGDGSVESLADVLSSLSACRKDAFGKGEEAAEASLAVSQTLDWALVNVNATLAVPHAEALLSLARRVDEVYQGMLDERSALDNNGLLRRTHALLEARPDIAESFQNRFKLVMVDEFQDTNQMQVDLVEAVAGRGLLCTVGDAQQSIYRFNGADVSVFNKRRDRVRAEVEAGGSAAEKNLDANFRSHADILAFVRKVCGQPSVFGSEFLDLVAKRDEKGVYKGDGPRIELQLLSYDGSKEDTGVVEAEAALIAERFAKLREAGHKASEMVVLVGKTTNVDAYAAALRARDFECIVGGGRSFFTLTEVQVVVNVLAALANPGDSEALFASLTSPMIHLSADDFLVLSTWEKDGQLNAMGIEKGLLKQDAVDCSPRLRFALDLYRRAIARIKDDRPSRILQDMLVESGWLGRLEKRGAEGTCVAANVLKAVRLVEELEGKPGYALPRVARDFRDMAKNLGSAPASLSVSNQDAVRLMTVHKSKGLEFPIVAVASYEPWDENSSVFSMTADSGEVFLSLALKEGRVFSSSGKPLGNGYANEVIFDPREAKDAAEFAAAIRNFDKREELDEARRLFYVACTRASEYLLISGLLKVTKSNGNSADAYASTPILDDVRCALMGPELGLPEVSDEIEYGGSAPLRFVRKFFSKESPFEAELGEPVEADEAIVVPVVGEKANFGLESVPMRKGTFSYSSIAPHEDHLPVEERDDLSGASSMPEVHMVESGGSEGEGIEFVIEGGPSATDVGSAFHRVGQLAVLRSSMRGGLKPPPSVLVDSVARSYRIEGASRERLDVALSRWFASDVARKAEAFERVRAEVPFMVAVPFPAGEVCFMEGEIDLLAETSDGSQAFVIDYKTGGSDTESRERLQAKHALQATCYAYALLTTQAYDHVEFAFVRVEREDAENPGQPQVVSYAFERDDLIILEEAIVRAYLLAESGKR